MIILNNLILIILTLVFILLIALITAPLESLAWFTGFQSRLDQLPKKKKNYSKTPQKYLIYLSGIGMSGRYDFTRNEEDFISKIKHKFKHIHILDNIYPYSPINDSLTAQRVFAIAWNFIVKSKKRIKYLRFLVNIRNMFQVFVSVDPRYGPLFNFATAEKVIKQLLENSYQYNSKNIIYLLSSSGGTQIALGISEYLKKFFECDVVLISIGGTFSSSDNFKHIAGFYDISGSRDNLYKFVSIIYPGRWAAMRNSYWNRAIKTGKVNRFLIGGVTHNGDSGYYGNSTKSPVTGKTNVEQLIDILKTIL